MISGTILDPNWNIYTMIFCQFVFLSINEKTSAANGDWSEWVCNCGWTFSSGTTQREKKSQVKVHYVNQSEAREKLTWANQEQRERKRRFFSWTRKRKILFTNVLSLTVARPSEDFREVEKKNEEIYKTVLLQVWWAS